MIYAGWRSCAWPAPLGLPLATAVSVLDGPTADRRHQAVQEIQRLEDLIVRAQGAIDLLSNARDCPRDHPASQCPAMHEALDAILAGAHPIRNGRDADV